MLGSYGTWLPEKSRSKVSLGTILKRDPLITRVSVGTSETFHTFRTHLRGFTVKCQDEVAIRAAWESGETADTKDYILINANETWWEDDVYSGGKQWVLYLKSTSGTVGVTVMEWK